MFYDKLLELCVERDISPSRAAEDVGMTGAHVTRWKRGSVPIDTTVQKFANYFNVPVGFFYDEKTAPVTEDGLQSMADDERALLEHYRTMTESDREMMRDLARRLKNGS